MDLRDDRWTGLLGGYRVPYDPRKALLALERGESVDSAWNELWNELHHQGDVGEASFVAVPHLVRIHKLRGIPDWNTYLIASIIELARDNPRNPKLPADFEKPYETAWTQLVEIGLRALKLAEGLPLVTGIIGVLAIAKGQRTIGQLAIEFTEDERAELLSKAGWS